MTPHDRRTNPVRGEEGVATDQVVRNLRDRRKDLYGLSWIKKADAIRDEELLAQGDERTPAARPSRRKAIAAG